jgi:hypothetical protein
MREFCSQVEKEEGATFCVFRETATQSPSVPTSFLFREIL